MFITLEDEVTEMVAGLDESGECCLHVDFHIACFSPGESWKHVDLHIAKQIEI